MHENVPSQTDINRINMSGSGAASWVIILKWGSVDG